MMEMSRESIVMFICSRSLKATVVSHSLIYTNLRFTAPEPPQDFLRIRNVSDVLWYLSNNRERTYTMSRGIYNL